MCIYFWFQAIKESATELLFGGHETTASTATSLVMFLGLNPEVVDRLRQELMDRVNTLFILSSIRFIQCLSDRGRCNAIRQAHLLLCTALNMVTTASAAHG